MDKKYGPQWHVACGEGFGFNVTCVEVFFAWGGRQQQLTEMLVVYFVGRYEQKHVLYMFFGGTGRLTAVLVFKSCEA